MPPWLHAGVYARKRSGTDLAKWRNASISHFKIGKHSGCENFTLLYPEGGFWRSRSCGRRDAHRARLCWPGGESERDTVGPKRGLPLKISAEYQVLSICIYPHHVKE